MSLSTQSVYIAQAQQIQSLWNQLWQWYYAVQKISNLTTENAAQNVWKAMATAAQNADGSLGAADASPVNTHPITAGTPALDMTANDIINALNDMVMITNVFNGTLTAASYTQTDHRADAISLNNVTG